MADDTATEGAAPAGAPDLPTHLRTAGELLGRAAVFTDDEATSVKATDLAKRLAGAALEVALEGPGAEAGLFAAAALEAPVRLAGIAAAIDDGRLDRAFVQAEHLLAALPGKPQSAPKPSPRGHFPGEPLTGKAQSGPKTKPKR